MYAVARLNSFDLTKLAVADDKVEHFDKVHRAQPGYVGTVVVDLQAGRRLVHNLWESEEHGAAALSVLGPAVGRVLNPPLSAPSELVGVGTVIATDLIPTEHRTGKQSIGLGTRFTILDRNAVTAGRPPGPR